MEDVLWFILIGTMIVAAVFLRGLLWVYGKKFGDKYYSSIKSNGWREWFGVVTLIVIIWGGGAVLLSLF